VDGNPVRYTDPSGHGKDCGLGESCVIDPYTSPLNGNSNSSSGGSSSSSGDGNNSSDEKLVDVVLDDSSDIAVGYISNEDLIAVSQGITHELTKDGGLYDQEEINAILRGALLYPLSFAVDVMVGLTVCGASIFICPSAIGIVTYATDTYILQVSSKPFDSLENASEYFYAASQSHDDNNSNPYIYVRSSGAQVEIDVQGQNNTLVLGWSDYHNIIAPYLADKVIAP
jgi:hypothetical protein